MTDDDLDELLGLLDDFSLDGPGIDSENLKQRVLFIPHSEVSRSGSPTTAVGSTSIASNFSEPKRVLIVSSGGGHLEQAIRLEPRIPVNGERVWVTFDSPQSRFLLEGRDVRWVPKVETPAHRRDLVTDKAFRENIARAGEIVGSRSETAAIVSVGSTIALAYLPIGALRRIPTFYIESATSIGQPTLIGRFFKRVPGIRTLSQSHEFDEKGWTYCGSVFDEYSPLPPKPGDVDPPVVRKVVVSLGLNGRHEFRRLLEKLAPVLKDPKYDVTWQIGVTNIDDLDLKGRVVRDMDRDQFLETVRQADMVIAHAGAGIALTANDVGKRPLLVPRETRDSEFHDDGQISTARAFTEAGLAMTVRAHEIDARVINRFASFASIEHIQAGKIAVA